MKNQKICVLDYGSGNVGSVYNLLNRLNYNVKISNSSLDIKNSSHLILPGVGAFGASIEKISEKELDSYMDMVFEIKDRENQLNRKYHTEFKKVLPPYKVMLLYKSKREFKKEILRMIKKRNSEQRPTRRFDN